VLFQQFIELRPHPPGVTRVEFLAGALHDEGLKIVGDMNLRLSLSRERKRKEKAGEEGGGRTCHTLNNAAMSGR
jgi:hypothetical protein